MRSSFWRLYANDRDGFHIVLNDQTLELRGGACYLVPANLSWSGRSVAPVGHFYLHFDLFGPPPVSLARHFRALLEVPPSAGLQALLSAGRAACAAFSACPDALSSLEFKALVFHALAGILAALSDEKRQEMRLQTQSLAPIRAALDEIEAQLARPPSNAQLARVCGYSQDHFIARFRALVGQTPARYALERRLSRAAQWLLFSEMSIEEIARSLGFCDRFHFSRAFAAFWNASPAAYRRDGIGGRT